MAKETFVILAYLVIWGGLLAYLAALTARQRALSRRVEALAASLPREED